MTVASTGMSRPSYRSRGELTRMHQIDFCQAINFPCHKKYEHEGGPGLAACFEVIEKYSAQPVRGRLNLISWTIFNFLIGNADAHAKNLSLLITRNGISLAPFYDLVSTAIYRELTDKLALRIGAENRPDWIRRRHWVDFAKVFGANPRIVWGRLAEMVETTPGETGRIAQNSTFAGKAAPASAWSLSTIAEGTRADANRRDPRARFVAGKAAFRNRRKVRQRLAAQEPGAERAGHPISGRLSGKLPRRAARFRVWERLLPGERLECPR